MSEQKIEAFWKNATADDVARVMAGEAVEARFRDSETMPWGDCLTLTGWVNERRHQWRSAEAGGRWNHCQVYREPSWYATKPDPGPGYRLLGKFPDEPKLGTDEAWRLDIQKWIETAIDDGIQVEGVWYRRRIEPVAPSLAEARVDLALAAMRHKAHCDAFQRAEDAVDESKKSLLDAFTASGKIESVVKIDGDHYYFWMSGTKLFFRKIEVL